MNKKELNEIKKQLKYENETLYLKGIQEGYGRCNDGEPVVRFTRLIHGDTLEKERSEEIVKLIKLKRDWILMVGDKMDNVLS